MEQDHKPDCDWVEDCEMPGTNLVAVAPEEGMAPQPVGFLCGHHNDILKREVHEGDKKMSLDIHFHRHTIIGVVSDEEDRLVSGERYAQGGMVQ